MEQLNNLFSGMNDFGKLFVIIGIIFILFGLLSTIFTSVTSLPRLPGDIYIKKDGFTLYFPIVTSILVSIILTIILNLFTRR